MILLCEYCEHFGTPASKLDLGDKFITQHAKYTVVGDGKEYSIPMNYCPNCGEYIGIKQYISHEILIDNIKKKIIEYNDVGGIEVSKLTLELMNKYKLDKEKAQELIEYARTH